MADNRIVCVCFTHNHYIWKHIRTYPALWCSVVDMVLVNFIHATTPLALTWVPDYHTSTWLILVLRQPMSNTVSHWLSTNLESDLWVYISAIMRVNRSHVSTKVWWYNHNKATNDISACMFKGHTEHFISLVIKICFVRNWFNPFRVLIYQ